LSIKEKEELERESIIFKINEKLKKSEEKTKDKYRNIRDNIENRLATSLDHARKKVDSFKKNDLLHSQELIMKPFLKFEKQVNIVVKQFVKLNMIKQPETNEKKSEEYQIKLQKVYDKIEKIEEDRKKKNKIIVNKYRKILKQNIKHKVITK
jgi:hypothetical protein